MRDTNIDRSPRSFEELFKATGIPHHDLGGFDGKHLHMRRTKQIAPSLTPIEGACNHTLVYHLSGSQDVKHFKSGKLENDGTRLSSTSLLPAGEDGAWLFPQAIEVLHFYFEDQNMGDFAERELDMNADRLDFIFSFSQADPFMAQLMPNLLNELAHTDTVSSLMMDQYEMLLTGHILRRYGNLSTSQKKRLDTKTTDAMQAAITRTRDYIEANLDSVLEMDELAAAAELSPWRFARAFKRSTGMTPYQYILNRRIEQAQAMLKSTLPLIDIAYACGFSSQQHMTNIFSKRLGVTPAQYRKETLT